MCIDVPFPINIEPVEGVFVFGMLSKILCISVFSVPTLRCDKLQGFERYFRNVFSGSKFSMVIDIRKMCKYAKLFFWVF